MAKITDDTMALVAASLTESITALKCERQRSMGLVQSDPIADVRDTYVDTLRYLKAFHS